MLHALTATVDGRQAWLAGHAGLADGATALSARRKPALLASDSERRY
ncbi:hypothetical protein ACRS3X_18050 [Ectopseudomonas hydrolytica]